jgi:hypothetical protein
MILSASPKIMAWIIQSPKIVAGTLGDTSTGRLNGLIMKTDEIPEDERPWLVKRNPFQPSWFEKHGSIRSQKINGLEN